MPKATLRGAALAMILASVLGFAGAYWPAPEWSFSLDYGRTAALILPWLVLMAGVMLLLRLHPRVERATLAIASIGVFNYGLAFLGLWATPPDGAVVAWTAVTTALLTIAIALTLPAVFED